MKYLLKCPKCGNNRQWEPQSAPLKGKSVLCFHCHKTFRPYTNVNKHCIVKEGI